MFDRGVDSSPAPSHAENPPGLLRAIAIASLVAGTLDYSAAITNFLLSGGKDPTRIAWYIASAFLGHDAAYAGGATTAALGYAMHYAIATSWTVLFFVSYPRLALLRKNALVIGPAYGLFVWTMMNLVLVPLTRIPSIAFNPRNAAIQAAILMVCIGPPIALLARRHYAQR